MQKFDKIIAMAAKHHGGMPALEKKLSPYKALKPKTIAALSDAQILSEMTHRVFQAGFAWKVVDNKWAGFEAAFDKFNPRRCAFITEDRFYELLKDKRIIRNGSKISTVPVNAQFLLDLAAEHGSAAKFFAQWPDTDYVGLLELLKKRGSRLGGQSGMWFLRSIGKPSFIITRDVSAALIRDGVLTRVPSGKRDMAAVQKAFNQWSSESGRDLTVISRILAMSVGKAG